MIFATKPARLFHSRTSQSERSWVDRQDAKTAAYKKGRNGAEMCKRKKRILFKYCDVLEKLGRYPTTNDRPLFLLSAKHTIRADRRLGLNYLQIYIWVLRVHLQNAPAILPLGNAICRGNAPGTPVLCANFANFPISLGHGTINTAASAMEAGAKREARTGEAMHSCRETTPVAVHLIALQLQR